MVELIEAAVSVERDHSLRAELGQRPDHQLAAGEEDDGIVAHRQEVRDVIGRVARGSDRPQGHTGAQGYLVKYPEPRVFLDLVSRVAELPPGSVGGLPGGIGPQHHPIGVL